MNIRDWCEDEKNESPWSMWGWTVMKQPDPDADAKGGYVLVKDGESLEDVFAHICFLAKLNRADFADPWEGSCGGDFFCGKKDDPKCRGDFVVNFGTIDPMYTVVHSDLLDKELAEGEENQPGYFERMGLK